MDEPDFESYTLDELHDAHRRIDREEFSERFDRLEREIQRREIGVVEHVPTGEEGSRSAFMGLTGRRIIAFGLDYMVVVILWSVIENLLFFPVPRLLLIALSFVLFVGYFVVTENLVSGSASPGKRAMGVVVDGDGQTTLSQGLIRATVVAAIWGIVWDQLLMFDLFAGWPSVTLSVATGLQCGLYLYVLSFFLRTPPVRDLPHDQWTKSYVRLDEAAPGPSPAGDPGGLFPTALAVSLLIGVAATVGLTVFASKTFGGDPKAAFENSIGLTTQDSRTIAEAVQSDTSIRTRAAVETVRTWSTNAPAQTTLNVKLWIPAVKWTASNRQKVIQSVVEQLRVEPGAFDNGKIELWTGGDYLSLSEHNPLNLP